MLEYGTYLIPKGVLECMIILLKNLYSEQAATVKTELGEAVI